MNETIRILIVEDLPTDAELAEREINKVLKPCTFQRVETREDYLTALNTFQPDLIISDYNMPRFDGLTALKLALEHTPMTPVIILTGAINEDTAVACMKAGAADYVIKEHIKRLGQAVIHALEEKQLRLERYQAEKALRESEARYRTLVHTLPDAITVTDSAGKITYVSPSTVSFYGHDIEDEILGRNILDWVHTDYHEKAIGHIKTVLTGSFIANQEYLLLKKSGTFFFGEVSASCLQDAQGQAIGIIIIVRDISERKQAEEQIKASLQEKEVLLKEIHHRVKNNMQVISSLLDLQADNIREQAIREIFQESRQRIKSMALIHEQLYQSKDLARIDFAEYAERLINHLLHSYGAKAGKVALHLNIAPLFLSIKTALPCGLIINELVSNALKYAFPNGQAGEVQIALQSVEEQQFILVVGDNGVGLPPDFDFYRAKSLGLTLVNTLVRQIKGEVELQSVQGAKFKITFTNEIAQEGS